MCRQQTQCISEITWLRVVVGRLGVGRQLLLSLLKHNSNTANFHALVLNRKENGIF